MNKYKINLSLLKDRFFESMNAGVLFFNNEFVCTYNNKTGKKYLKKGETIDRLRFINIDKIKNEIREKLCKSDSEIKSLNITGKDKDGEYYALLIRKLKIEKSETFCFSITIIDKKIFNLLISSLEYNPYINELMVGSIHDLKNILFGIKGNAELLLKKGKNKDIDKNINRIVQLADSAEKYTKGILALVSYNKEIEYIEFCKELNDIVDEFKKIVPKRIKFYFDKLQDSKIGVKITPLELSQIFLNLLTNSIDAITKNGKIHIKVEKTEDEIILSIKDNGKGMDKETLNNIFKPFKSSKKNGTGLGMYLVLSIIKRRNGTIKVLSKEGEGTNIEIAFPYEYLSERKKQKVKEERLKEDVLIVEDSKFYSSLIASVIKKLGYKPLIAENLSQAKEIILDERRNILFIILDIILPDGNGFELINPIKKHLNNPNIIITSTLKFKDIKDKIPKYNNISFLPKPYVISKLIDFFINYNKKFAEKVKKNELS